VPVDATHIAVAAPLSGVSAHLGREMAQAARLAVEEHNASERAGVAGSVVADVLDDAGDPRTGTALAADLCSRPEVLGVVGHYNSDVTLATAPVYAQAGLPMITPIVSNPALTERGWRGVFRLTNRDDATARAIAGYLRSRLGKRAAVVAQTPTTYGASMAEQFVAAFTGAGGEVVGRYPVAEGERDFADLVAGLPDGFDVAFYGGSFEGAGLLRAVRAAGLGQLFATGDGCWDVSGFLEPAGSAAEAGEGVLVLAASPQIGQVPGSAEFADRYAARYGPIGNYAVNSYDATRALLAALTDAALTDAALADAVRDDAGLTEVDGGGRRPGRAGVMAALGRLEFDGIAYPRPTRWDDHGDNLATATYLNVVAGGRYQQIAEVPNARL
jgi:branched-chain amino acid transport system substrate-binding protein